MAPGGILDVDPHDSGPHDTGPHDTGLGDIGIRRVGVVGGGAMGAGIALEFAAAGAEVVVLTRSARTGAAAMDRIRADLTLLTEHGLFPANQVADALGRVRPTTELAELAGAEHVVESVPEDLPLKRTIFAELDQLTGPDVLLASNTTSLPVSAIAAECVRPQRVLSTHYYLPAHLIPLVDVVPGRATDPAAVDRATALLTALGKTPVTFPADTGATVGPRLLTALIGESIKLVSEGVADPRTVDRVITAGIGRRLGVTGVFDRLDLAGLDTVAAVLRQQGRPVPPILAEKLARGDLGRTSGRGFYSWSPAETAAFERGVGDHLARQLLAERPSGQNEPGHGTVLIDPGVLDPYLATARRAYLASTPLEPPSAFAVLVGERDADTGAIVVRRANQATNVRPTDPDVAAEFAERIVPCFGSAYANRHRGFWCDSGDQLRIQRQADADGLEILGSIHLHPDWHRIGPPGERGLRISQRPTPMDVHMFGQTGWPLNLICYLERHHDTVYATIGAWGRPDPVTGGCPELTIQHGVQLGDQPEAQSDVQPGTPAGAMAGHRGSS